NLMTTEGYLQAVNYNFVSNEFETSLLGEKFDEKHTGLVGVQESIKISNPISEDLNVMRRRIFTTLFKNLVHNFRHGSNFGRLFETGHVFYKQNGEYLQNLHLGLCAWGQKAGLWQKDNDRPAVYDIKASIENLLLQLNISQWQWREIPEVPEFLHPYQSSALFLEGRIVGFIGSLHPSLLEEYKIRATAAMGELDVAKLMRGQPRIPKIQTISKFPAVTRDFSFVLSKEQKVYDILTKIKKVGGKLLQEVEVFDEFQGGQLVEGERSVSFRLTYQDMDGTLDEARLSQLQNDILAKVK
ncbi:MAG: phenylalanine--tRNA ligase subunit beta, partial [Bdellovibrionales bacterium]|nr:phenylalanine--tRNA ligase subunit beta [Bdellovibrionales bacterium]